MHTQEPDPDSQLMTGGGGRLTRFYRFPVTAVLLSLWAYLCTLVIAAVAPRFLAADGTREVVALLPMLVLLYVMTVIYSVYRASDEYQRLRILRCTALTAVILAFSTLGYVCLERFGYPPLSMVVVNLYGWTIFTVALLWVLYREG